ncbi:MAG: StbB family protein [Rubrivivax sp.]|nr:StbB family protein [Rubrivivax sp.]
MKLAVINFSGNVGKSTITRHLLAPRLPGARVIAVESINADEGQEQSLRGFQFGELQEYLQAVDDVVVDIGASNVEELMRLMHRYRGSHEEFDCFIVPTVPPPKQQQDTIATLADLHAVGVPPDRIQIIFNMVDDREPLERVFHILLAFLEQQPIASANSDCRIGINEVYARVRGTGTDLAEIARDETDYKRLIARAGDRQEKMSLGQKLATRRLARGVVPELDACFAALNLGQFVTDEAKTAGAAS